jgi:hypothetical protein
VRVERVFAESEQLFQYLVAIRADELFEVAIRGQDKIPLVGVVTLVFRKITGSRDLQALFVQRDATR